MNETLNYLKTMRIRIVFRMDGDDVMSIYLGPSLYTGKNGWFSVYFCNSLDGACKGRTNDALMNE
jgi:hypothetical protein